MPPKKPEAPKKNRLNEVLFILFGFYFLWLVYVRIQAYVRAGGWELADSLWGRTVAFFVHYVIPGFELLGVVTVILAVSGIVYSLTKLRAIAAEERAIYSQENVEATTVVVPDKNEKWERVIAHINSANSADWKLAIIEADIMLEDLLRAAGYHGDSIGDMLKAVEKSDFLTIEAAWEAHKVRNQVAHQGGDFNLNERDAKRVISLFESVFKEFKII
jgi:hypothetical protein